MSKIKTWNERCEEHPDHQTGMVSNSMIQARMQEEIDDLRAALAEPTVKESLQVESAVAEIATTQQQLDNKPPSDYRRGYWDGFAIGKREGRIEAEDALAEPVQEPVAWTPVTEALPQSGVKVLACYRNRLGNLRRIRAMWTAAKTEEADSEDAETCSEYDEATDTYYVTEGWYECIDNWGDYSSVAVTEGEVTHWMPLPPDPDCAPSQRPAEPVQEPNDKTASIRWQLCLLAQTEEFSDDVRNQIGRGVWLIDRLRAALAEPVQDHFPDATKMVQEPVAYSVGRTLYWHEGKGVNDVQLYLAPPQRPAKPQGCDHCNHPLYAATKCRVCGRAHGIGGEG